MQAPALEPAYAIDAQLTWPWRNELASSNDRVLALIDLFTEIQPVWTTEALIQKQGTSRATTYRDLKALVASGFLAPVAPGAYALGPRFIELDRQIRLADPLLKVAPPIMAAQRMKVQGTQLLFRYYGIRVLSIHEDRTDDRIENELRSRPTLYPFSGVTLSRHPRSSVVGPAAASILAARGGYCSRWIG